MHVQDNKGYSCINWDTEKLLLSTLFVLLECSVVNIPIGCQRWGFGGGICWRHPTGSVQVTHLRTLTCHRLWLIGGTPHWVNALSNMRSNDPVAPLKAITDTKEIVLPPLSSS